MEKRNGRKPIDDVLRYYVEAQLDNVSFDLPLPVRMLVTYGLMKGAVAALRSLVKSKRVSWREPFAQLEYNYHPFHENWPSEVIDFKDYREMVGLAVMNAVTRSVFIHENGIYPKPGTPEEVKKELASLTDEQLAAGFELQPLPHEFTIDTAEGPQTANIALRFAIRPLTIEGENMATGRAYYPLHVGLEITEGNPSAWTEKEQDEIWGWYIDALDSLLEPFMKDLDARGKAQLPKPDRIKPLRAEHFKAPGRLFDTPRHVTGKNKTDLLPEISRWYQQTAFNRTVGMAAAALTKMDTRETILDWQSATVEEVADLVFCRSEDGTPAHGEHRERILKAFEALRAIPVPIVKVEWKRIGTDRNPRWQKDYKFRIASLLQSYGATFVEKKTGKRVFADDPAKRKDLVKAKPDRRKITRELVKTNPADGILQSFPPDRYTLTGFEWRWNTDIAEDFICPQIALDKKDRPRLKMKGGRHIEGSRFIMLNRNYFSVQKHLRAAGSIYAPRLLDLLVSEKKHITSRGRGTVWIEIEAEKIIKWLDLWPEFQNHPKRVLEDRIAPAVMSLIKEKVMLPDSWLVPQKDKNEERRKKEYYRWKVAELWSTVALVPEEEAKEIEDEMVALAEAEEAARSQQQPEPPVKAEQVALPGMETASPIPSGADIRDARNTAGLTIRRFAEAIGGPDFSTWSRYETGKPIRTGSIAPEVWQRVRDFIAQHRGNK